MLSFILTPSFLSIDAGNDAHAGYTLYNRLQSMITLMQTPPDATWFSFNNHAGFLCNEDGHPWHPINPNYDPGPLPPNPPTEAQLNSAERRKLKREELLLKRASSASSQLQADALHELQVQLKGQPDSSLSQGAYSQHIVPVPTTTSRPTIFPAQSSNQARLYHQFAMRQDTLREDNYLVPLDPMQLSMPPSHFIADASLSSVPPATPPLQHQIIRNQSTHGHEDGRGRRVIAPHAHDAEPSNQVNPAQYQHRNSRYSVPYRRYGSKTACNLSITANSKGLRDNVGGDL